MRVLKRVLRAATADDLELFHTQKEREKAILIRSRAIAKEFKLEMKVCEVELQADGKKATFFYTADSRVDFRELIKVYATDFKVKVEMRQIGARQESAKVGGIGSCRKGVVLQHLAYRFQIGKYQYGTLSKFINQSNQIIRSVWSFEMLFELRIRYLFRCLECIS